MFMFQFITLIGVEHARHFTLKPKLQVGGGGGGGGGGVLPAYLTLTHVISIMYWLYGDSISMVVDKPLIDHITHNHVLRKPVSGISVCDFSLYGVAMPYP